MRYEFPRRKGQVVSEADSYNPAICCFCGSDEYSLVAAGPTVPLIACTKCGLMRQGFASRTEKRPFVSYAGEEGRFHQQREDKEAAQIADFLKIMLQLEKLLPEKGRLLEIGCAMGTLLNEIRKLGWKVTGVEPEKRTCEIARNRYELDVISSTFQEAEIEECSFDVVLLLHVIEHLPDPETGLSQVARLIRPGGLLVLETPRYDTLSFKLLKGRERSVIAGHYHYFTRATIRMLVRKSGFEVVRLDSVGRTLTLDRLCFYAAKFLDSGVATRMLIRFSDGLHLNKVRVYINLHDMMRLYLRRVG
jgi:2-polyprenyl-3-methyl-5-hydroxy-6-metoxy-1,4-benzoquinol methylase